MITEPSVLELRYRRWLRLLPRTYRAVREEEMVATFLERSFGDDPDNADLTAKYGGVGRAEALSIVALALRLRWADPAGPDRYRWRAQLVRAATLTCVCVLAVQSIDGLLSRLWAALRWKGPESPTDIFWGVAAGQPDVVWQAIRQWAWVVWIVVAALALVRTPVALRWAAGAAAVPVVVLLVEPFQTPGPPPLLHIGVNLAVGLGVIVGLLLMSTARVSPAPLRFARGWIVSGVTVFVLYEVVPVVATIPVRDVTEPSEVPDWLGVASLTLWSIDGLWLPAALGALVVMLVRRSTSTSSGKSILAAALAISAVATLTHLATIVDYYIPAGWQITSLSPTAAAAIASTTVAVTTAITVTATCGLIAQARRLPAVTYGSAN